MAPKPLLLAGFLVLSLFPDSLPGEKKNDGDMAGVIYLGNYDGDTIRFDIPGVHPLLGKNIAIRLRGVDTPEIRGKCPEEREKAVVARDFVRGILAKAKRITLTNTERGKYFRIVARVMADGVDVSGALLKTGLAMPYQGGKKIGTWCGGNLGLRGLRAEP